MWVLCWEKVSSVRLNPEAPKLVRSLCQENAKKPAGFGRGCKEYLQVLRDQGTVKGLAVVYLLGKQGIKIFSCLTAQHLALFFVHIQLVCLAGALSSRVACAESYQRLFDFFSPKGCLLQSMVSCLHNSALPALFLPGALAFTA